MIFNVKTQANPESSVGLMSMGGKGPEVLVTLTTDLGKVLDGIHRTKIRGSTHLATGIQIAGVRGPTADCNWMDEVANVHNQLALKHRQNKTQRQRIIVFICSPIHEDEKTLSKLAKRMKKNAVSIDFIAFGDLDPTDVKKLEVFNENVKGPEGSHVAIIPPGPSLLSDQIIASPILSGDGVAPRGGENGVDGGGESGAGGFEFGVDPSTDPELALALRMSMEEEKARQEKENKAKAEAAVREQALAGIPEEPSETQPLLNQNGEASGSGSVPQEEKKGPEDDPDKMDTA